MFVGVQDLVLSHYALRVGVERRAAVCSNIAWLRGSPLYEPGGRGDRLLQCQRECVLPVDGDWHRREHARSLTAADDDTRAQLKLTQAVLCPTDPLPGVHPRRRRDCGLHWDLESTRRPPAARQHALDIAERDAW